MYFSQELLLMHHKLLSRYASSDDMVSSQFLEFSDKPPWIDGMCWQDNLHIIPAKSNFLDFGIVFI
jgi:hypothetical protein